MRYPGAFFARLWVRLRARWLDPLRARLVLREERRLLCRGPAPTLERPSVVFFSMHRSGSSFMHRLLRQAAEAEGFRAVNLERYFTLTGRSLDSALASETFRKRVFSPLGYFYGVFRDWHPIPNLSDYRVLLVLRDPRDVLTSQFYSLTRGHRMMSAAHHERRLEARRMGIDAFVLDRAPGWCRRYRAYFEHLLGRPEVMLVRYEDLIGAFEDHLERIGSHLGLSLSTAAGESPGDFTVDREDPRAHKRQVSWGDYRDKLQPDTIRKLNRSFSDVLDELNYPTGGEPLSGHPGPSTR